MPYIKPLERIDIDEMVGDLVFSVETAGQLNYAITRMVHLYTMKKSVKYDTLNEVVGVLHSVKQEYDRRVVAPYEDKKVLENGDIGVL